MSGESKSPVKTVLKIVLPWVVVLIGFGVMQALAGLQPPPVPKDLRVDPPVMTVQPVTVGDQRLQLRLNGTVRAVTETNLAAEVGGLITYVAPNLAVGGTFAKDEVLVRIDARDYQTAKAEAEAMIAGATARAKLAEADIARLAVQRSAMEIGEESAEAQIGIAQSEVTAAEARLAEADAGISAAASELARARAAMTAAEAALKTEEAQSKLARDEWQKYGQGEPSPLVLREPQLAEARARIESARAAIEAAISLGKSAEAAKAGAAATLAGVQQRKHVAGLAKQSSGKQTELVDKQVQAAEAALENARADALAASAALSRAELGLSRTEIRAPFDGRVLSHTVGVGQHLPPGGLIARIYATDWAEVELPVPVAELGHLGLSEVAGENRAKVVVEAEMGGEVLRWDGVLHRTGGRIDPATRVLPIMVRIADPAAGKTFPLLPGSFVTATIQGRVASGVARLPRQAVRFIAPPQVVAASKGSAGDGWMLVAETVAAPAGADAGGSYVRLTHRAVTVLRWEDGEVLVSAGLSTGERVAVTAMESVTEGMVARLASANGSQKPDGQKTDGT